jgi:hypothetical protein
MESFCCGGVTPATGDALLLPLLLLLLLLLVPSTRQLE